MAELCGRSLRLWELSEAHPGVPLFSGGLVDAWPAWALESTRIVREELGAVRALEQTEKSKTPRRQSHG